MADREILVACDGSCLKNPGGATGWAWAAADGRWASACQPVGTNQVAELWGVLSVLRDFPVGNLVIQVDSEYARKVAVTWAAGWARRGWRVQSGEPVKNLALVQAIHRRMTVREDPVRFLHVPGHDRANRWPLNTIADIQAGRAAEYARKHQATEEFSGGGPAVLHAAGPLRSRRRPRRDDPSRWWSSALPATGRSTPCQSVAARPEGHISGVSTVAQPRVALQ